MRNPTSAFRRILCRALAAAVLVLAAGNASGEADKPIIAHMLADRDAYDGQALTIYGLVVEVVDGGRAFMLQDVSQMPLKVVPPQGEVIMVGDQILVRGRFFAEESGARFEATDIVAAKVLGGGGCC